MIIQCKSCSRKFVVNDNDIPKTGREVQCGYCSVTWHQLPDVASTTQIKKIKPSTPIDNAYSIDDIKASDGKTYPPSMLPEEVKKLKGFIWRESEQPKKMEDIFIIDSNEKKAPLKKKKLKNIPAFLDKKTGIKSKKIPRLCSV